MSGAAPEAVAGEPAESPTRYERRWRLLSILLLIAGVGQCVAGLYFLTIHPDAAGDYEIRCMEQFHIRRGWNPWTAAEHVARGQTADLPAYDPRIGLSKEDFDLDRPFMGGYPPWAMATNELLVPPLPFPAGRCYLAVLDVLALAFLVWWSARRLRPYGRWAGILGAASVLAMSSIFVGMRYGQFTIIVVAAMAGTIHLLESRKQAGAGLAFCLAVTKPQMASLLIVPMLWQRAWTAVAIAAIVLVAASLITWVRVGVDPLTLTLQMFAAFKSWDSLGADAGLANLLIAGGVDRSVAAKVGVLLAFAGTGILVHRWRHLPLLHLSAISMVLARTLTYHRRYDDLMLVFLLLALLEVAFRTRRRLVIVAFVLTAVSVWMPLNQPLERFPPVFYGRCLIWLGGLAVLLAATPRPDPAADMPKPAAQQVPA
jgi:hypothetical protein